MSSAPKYIIEIATTDFVTTASAVKGGADRIELCANLEEGGVTPSHAAIKISREKFSIPIFPIIRPRGGDFLYTNEEFEIMKNDVLYCKQLGCDGIVIGLLNKDGSIDKKRTSRLIELGYPMGVTFHRAFDRCIDPFVALDELIDLGCERILTSGQQPSVSTGMKMISVLNDAADGRIIIMPGSGVRKENIKELAEKTGCVEFHSSLRSKTNSSMEYLHPAFEKDLGSYSNNAIDPAEVIALRNALH